MPHRMTAPKSPTRQVQGTHAAAAAGPHGIALAPPAYGIDVVDRAPARRLGLQAQLTVRAPGDRYEQEADRVAAQVVQHLHTPARFPAHHRHPLALQAPPVQAGALQRTSPPQLQGSAGSKTAPPAVVSALHRSHGAGHPLADPIRLPLERAFGTDFRGVKVHTDAQADGLSRSMQAKAFTSGEHIFFRHGAYRPADHDGQALLAHELTHVLQQNRSTGEAVIQRQTMEFHADSQANFQPQKDAQDFVQPWPKPQGDWRKLDIGILPSENFKNNHIRQAVDEATARAALQARPANIQENTIFQRDRMITAAAALAKPYYVQKTQIGHDVGVRVKDVPAFQAQRQGGQIRATVLHTFTGWLKLRGTLNDNGRILLEHIDQWAG